MTFSGTLWAGCAIWLAAGCAPAQPAEAPEEAVDQLTRGESVYAQACGGCHGENGEGTEGRPPLVGEAALPEDPPPTATTRTAKLHTAKDLFDFVKSDMPPIAPGSLDDADTWAVVAYVMKQRGKHAGGKDLDAAAATALELR
jgi:mono/diheme cytochrome c family protein